MNRFSQKDLQYEADDQKRGTPTIQSDNQDSDYVQNIRVKLIMIVDTPEYWSLSKGSDLEINEATKDDTTHHTQENWNQVYNSLLEECLGSFFFNAW